VRDSRILVIGPFAAGQLAASYARALERLGREVIRVDSDRAYYAAVPGARLRIVRRVLRAPVWNRLNRQTIDIVRSTRPNLVIVVKGTYQHPETIRFIRRGLGVPIANYYPDNPFCGVPLNPRRVSAQRRDLVDALREYTRVWIWERRLAGRLAVAGVAAGYLPFGVDPDFEDVAARGRCQECAGRHPVVFVGNHTDKRQAHVAAVRRHRIGLWGSRWPRARRVARRHVTHARPLVGQACAATYLSASVSLNILDDLNMPGHNMRTFEIPGGGGLMLSTYTPEQDDFFPEGEAALYYRNPAELDDTIDRAVNDRSWAARLRARAVTIAANHGYTERARTMLSELA
jgi:hypothetical protein